jgi:hypothetical protein
MSGYRAPRPDRLPISASVWDVAQRYDPIGPTVGAAMFEALQQLEADVIKLQRGQATDLADALG